MNSWAGPGAAVAMMLEGTHVRLDHPEPSHLPFLVGMAVRHELAFRWLGPSAAAGPAELERALAMNTLASFIVTSTQIGVPVGLVACYDADLQHGHAKVALVSGDDPAAILLGVHGAMLLIEYLFSVWQFRRLYIEVPADWAFAAAAEAFPFIRHEARLRDHCFYRGGYHDLLVLAVDRQEWQETAGPLLDEIQDLGG